MQFLQLGDVTFPRKILIVGQRKVGKTPLLQWMLWNCYNAPRIADLTALEHDSISLCRFIARERDDDKALSSHMEPLLKEYFPVCDLRRLVIAYSLNGWNFLPKDAQHTERSFTLCDTPQKHYGVGNECNLFVERQHMYPMHPLRMPQFDLVIVLHWAWWLTDTYTQTWFLRTFGHSHVEIRTEMSDAPSIAMVRNAFGGYRMYGLSWFNPGDTYGGLVHNMRALPPARMPAPPRCVEEEEIVEHNRF